MRLRPRATEPEPSIDEPLAASVAGRVEEIVAAAEQSAARLQREIERGARAEAGNLRAEAEADAARIRSEAEASANRMDPERLAEVEGLIDALIAQATSVQRQAQAAEEVRRHLDDLISAVAEAADRLAEPAPESADARSSEITAMLSTSSTR